MNIWLVFSLLSSQFQKAPPPLGDVTLADGPLTLENQASLLPPAGHLWNNWRSNKFWMSPLILKHFYLKSSSLSSFPLIVNSDFFLWIFRFSWGHWRTFPEHSPARPRCNLWPWRACHHQLLESSPTGLRTQEVVVNTLKPDKDRLNIKSYV